MLFRSQLRTWEKTSQWKHPFLILPHFPYTNNVLLDYTGNTRWLVQPRYGYHSCKHSTILLPFVPTLQLSSYKLHILNMSCLNSTNVLYILLFNPSLYSLCSLLLRHSLYHYRNEPIEQSPFTSSTYICPFYSLCSPTPYPLV